MGRDKALLPYKGGALIEHVAATVREAAGSVTLIGPPNPYRRLGFQVIPDGIRSCGPIGGILTALHCSPAQWNLIVACDMPSLSSPFLQSLLAAAEELTPDCLIPISPQGQLEPLCAVYRRTCLPVIRDAVQHNSRKITDALTRLNVIHRPISETVWFENLNTPEDWAIHNKAIGAGDLANPPGQAHE
jgi:molybdopterin-guanine dinucleotide biosynthesis protein A